jgi:hypothetical protein
MTALSFLYLLYWLYCDVRAQIYAALSGAFSKPTVFRQDLDSFRNLPSTHFLYYLIDVMIRKRTVPSWFPSYIFPVSNSDCVGFLFVRCIQS